MQDFNKRNPIKPCCICTHSAFSKENSVQDLPHTRRPHSAGSQENEGHKKRSLNISSERVLRLYFFEDDNWNKVMINSKRYYQMLRNFVFPSVENTSGMWWEQDGATAH